MNVCVYKHTTPPPVDPPLRTPPLDTPPFSFRTLMQVGILERNVERSPEKTNAQQSPRQSAHSSTCVQNSHAIQQPLVPDVSRSNQQPLHTASDPGENTPGYDTCELVCVQKVLTFVWHAHARALAVVTMQAPIVMCFYSYALPLHSALPPVLRACTFAPPQGYYRSDMYLSNIGPPLPHTNTTLMMPEKSLGGGGGEVPGGGGGGGSGGAFS